MVVLYKVFFGFPKIQLFHSMMLSRGRAVSGCARELLSAPQGGKLFLSFPVYHQIRTTYYPHNYSVSSHIYQLLSQPLSYSPEFFSQHLLLFFLAPLTTLQWLIRAPLFQCKRTLRQNNIQQGSYHSKHNHTKAQGHV